MGHGEKPKKSVHKLGYIIDKCSHNSESVDLFQVILPSNSTARLHLDLSVYDINTTLCNIYEVSNGFKFIDGVLKQVGGNDVFSFEETAGISINYNIYYNRIFITASNFGSHLRYIAKLTLTTFHL